ncbi:nuclear transport factor 2 family protein [Rhizobium sp. P40RR-XXII]|uniref:nuclear transport factor 2 family protein n=1 Tax=Rhizobium sp. P40RR-XXII TaxID=2726739 RepID=UPI001457603F|nr:nuclear transport factor 2 family protein [Rhizobium sp. P40RR-XXII]NLS20733.1 nuclear transport factor 2 family protein [Rhizobium sp. P40RR-XXII]
MPTNEEIIRELYRTAEVKDVAAFVALFAEGGYFWDVSAGAKYYGADIGKTVEIYATAFHDMHRELGNFYVTDDVVIVELTLNGTHTGPLALPAGTIPATGKEMHAPCCDVFHLKDGKVTSFHCYTAATIIMGQLGVLGNLGAAMQRA